MNETGSAGRKDDHVRLAADQQAEGTRRNDFDDVTFLHHALDGIDAADVDTSVEVAGRTWSHPFHINAMTGGSAATGRINRDLAIAARETGVAIASGSLSAGLDDPALMPTFRVLREENPDGVVWANIGVERSADDARRAVDALAADGLQVHLNSIQETVMPEGSRHFSTWLGSLEAIRDAVAVPVIVKEVGFGLSTRTLVRLHDLGITYADVSGRGGTDFVRIENARRAGADYGYLTGWGQSAVASLLDAPAVSPVLLASGGVRTPLDVVRALALGARAVGVSGTFLAPVLDGGAEALIGRITEWSAHTRALLAVLGARTTNALTRTDLIIDGPTARYCAARGIDVTAWSHRSGAPTPTERSRHDR